MKNRGARKLELALEARPEEVQKIKGAVCIDLGSSHGGFARTLLENEAKRVYCVDVAYGILDYTLRIDPRVKPLERKNARNLDVSWFPDLMEGNEAERVYFTCDLSFISLRTVLSSVVQFLNASSLNHMDGIFLVKPQFEDSRSTEKGILRDDAVREAIIERTAKAAEELGFSTRGRFDLPAMPGKNLEVFLFLSWQR
ncbi:MAG: hypothetical protein JNM27_19515 [Leptospirales bacterium]|nr:hypothetical protein [Leptospirales bacterium]